MPKFKLHVSGGHTFLIETDGKEPPFPTADGRSIAFRLAGSDGRKVWVRASAVVAYEEQPEPAGEKGGVQLKIGSSARTGL